MKFGRYLEENATPEWKRAYINYRAVKKVIKRISLRLSKDPDPEAHSAAESDKSSSGNEDHGPTRERRRNESSPAVSTPGTAPRPSPGFGTGPSPTSPPIATPAINAKASPGRPHKSPNYGRRNSFGTGFNFRAESIKEVPRVPPPLDLGEPSLDTAKAGADTLSADSSGVTTTPSGSEQPSGVASPSTPPIDESRLHVKSDQRKRGKRRPGAVNFSPVIEAIPDDDEGLKEDGEQSTDSPSTGSPKSSKAASTPFIGPMAPKKGSRKSSPRLSPLLSRIASRMQPTVGVSPSGTEDAPSSGRSIRSLRLPSPRVQPYQPRTFDELYSTLQPDEKDFFDLLDHELAKVESFYVAREADATRRGTELRDQLRDLARHRQVFHTVFPEGVPDWEAAMGRLLPTQAQKPVMRAVQLRNPFTNNTRDEDHQVDGNQGSASRPVSRASAGGTPNGATSAGNGTPNGNQGSKDDDKARLAAQYDPDRYQKYKKELRVAMLEYYRQLELVKNYRIMNLTGFRKALKKFEKTTKIQCLELYTEDRISPCSFAHGDTIDHMLKQTEDLYTEAFEHGNAKRARLKLRRQDQPHKTHYMTVFRSGINIGVGVTLAIIAIVRSYSPESRQLVPAHASLMQVYGAFYIPVLFAMLFELNLIAWVDARINYEFVMELSHPILDYRSFLEIPSFLFLTLSGCMFFSFYPVATHSVAPTTWPLAWLVFVIVFFFNILPVMRRQSRYWFIKALARVLTPGYSRVEFIAFFLADEMNSLVYSIQMIFFMGCAYNHDWPANTQQVCPTSRSWPYALLACIPPLIRLIQCLKRYIDSQLRIHLINAGKYCSSILVACFFVYWRSKGNPEAHGSPSFIVWVIFATIASTYNSAWDLVVDWSLLRPHHKLLRPDLGYQYPILYYFAMVTDVLIRFIWVWYIPSSKKHTLIRGWVFAMAEMLRRWQWNFYRVETEHLGNADAYRVTREIPLPYRKTEEEEEDEEDARSTISAKRVDSRSAVSSKLRRIRENLVGQHASGRGADALNIGPRGHAGQREYEAQRPGDLPRRPGDPIGAGDRSRDSSDSGSIV